ncbi:MAG: hypothetical protein D6800_14690 [Candidatus Zixiibacteriota bacterium]|nr:MAG: hypothetical protein D6800_14690 [candidate division Zixibacteria bacterium]
MSRKAKGALEVFLAALKDKADVSDAAIQEALDRSGLSGKPFIPLYEAFTTPSKRDGWVVAGVSFKDSTGKVRRIDHSLPDTPENRQAYADALRALATRLTETA